MDNEITLHFMGWTLPNKSQIITLTNSGPTTLCLTGRKLCGFFPPLKIMLKIGHNILSPKALQFPQ